MKNFEFPINFLIFPASRTYPNLVEVTENSSVLSRARMAAELGEAELLGEQQLLECYQNEQLEFVDDFVDIFCQVFHIHLVLYLIDWKTARAGTKEFPVRSVSCL